MTNPEIYLYGMVLVSNSFLLKGDFPQSDTYSEFTRKYHLPGGETGSCATVLASLGVSTRVDGNHQGVNTWPVLTSFYKGKPVDLSPLTFDCEYDGLEDYVFIDKETRTPFGMFGSYYADPIERWNMPKEEDIKGAKVAAIDAYFRTASEEAARICVKEKIPYVTIDVHHESPVHRNAAITVLSGEIYGSIYDPDIDKEALFEKFTANTDGLVIFTRGSKPLWYGRKGEPRKELPPFKIDVVSTLGAGDTFKAGCTYALYKGMNDLDTVRFASACSGVACTRFPLPLNPPTLPEVQALLAKG